jgi:DNA-binding NarL/FixJ family response regulator
MESKIHVLLFNSHRLFAESVAALLGAQENFVLVGSVTDAHDLPDMLRSESPDVLLINASVETANTLSLIRKIKSESPKLKVIVFGIDRENESLLEFIEAGVSGYVLKDASFDELLKTLEDVHQRRARCSPRLTAMVFARLTQLSRKRRIGPQPTGMPLTPRETSILEFIALGMTNKEIAQRLEISVFTVKNHVHNILDKLQVSYRREAIRYALENGLLERHRLYRRSSAKRLGPKQQSESASGKNDSLDIF